MERKWKFCVNFIIGKLLPLHPIIFSVLHGRADGEVCHIGFSDVLYMIVSVISHMLHHSLYRIYVDRFGWFKQVCLHLLYHWFAGKYISQLFII